MGLDVARGLYSAPYTKWSETHNIVHFTSMYEIWKADVSSLDLKHDFWSQTQQKINHVEMNVILF